jgi:hypothetical protein
MQGVIFFLLLFYSISAFSTELEHALTTMQINSLFDEQREVSLAGLPDLVDREEKIVRCVDEYVKKQSKSYAKMVQNNLYDLLHNFDKIASKIYGKKPESDDIPYEDKIEILARIQCDIYHAIGTLR